MAKRTKISDIANQLGVSVTLVSFVLNGKSKEMRISDEMRLKVLELAERMNYKPNYHAKSLRTGKSHTIGLIVADISNPFFAQIARYVEKEASKYNYQVLFSSSDENKVKFATQLEVLKDRTVDGFILTPPIGSDTILIDLVNEKKHFVIIDRIFENVNATSININNYQAAYNATIRLIQNNRKKIALLNVNYELISMQQRAKGYMDALSDQGFEINPALIKNLEFSHEKSLVSTAIQEIIANQADAVLFTTNKLGIFGIESIREMGLSIPENLSIISFDDTDAYRISSTTISTIEQPLEKMCKEAVTILIKLIEGSFVSEAPPKIQLEVRFIPRESCL